MRLRHRLSVWFDSATDRMFAPHQCKCDCDGEWACGACGKCGKPVSCTWADLAEATKLGSDMARDRITRSLEKKLPAAPSPSDSARRTLLAGVRGLLARMDRVQGD